MACGTDALSTPPPPETTPAAAQAAGGAGLLRCPHGRSSRSKSAPTHRRERHCCEPHKEDEDTERDENEACSKRGEYEWGRIPSACLASVARSRRRRWVRGRSRLEGIPRSAPLQRLAMRSVRFSFDVDQSATVAFRPCICCGAAGALAPASASAMLLTSIAVQRVSPKRCRPTGWGAGKVEEPRCAQRKSDLLGKEEGKATAPQRKGICQKHSVTASVSLCPLGGARVTRPEKNTTA
jgi:hypothetical protein